MRILVTADIHLSASHPERQEALADVVRIAEEEDVEYLLIAGDMFDAVTDVDDVKTEIRDLFTDNDFRSFVIPGNHDEGAFREEDYFGDDLEVLSHTPFEQVDLGDVNLLAIPFTQARFGQLVDDIHDARVDEQLNVLLLHGTLSTATGDVFGHESRYLPFTPEQLLETGADYVFAGHIHSAPTRHTFGRHDCVFAYPGSPVSITTKETNKRGVWILDTAQQELRNVHVNSAYYRRETLDLIPGEAPEKLTALHDRLAGQDLANARLLVEPVGFIEMDEARFFEELESIVQDVDPADYRIDRTGIESAGAILDSELYRGFEEKLEAIEEVDRRAVRGMVLKALSRERRGSS